MRFIRKIRAFFGYRSASCPKCGGTVRFFYDHCSVKCPDCGILVDIDGGVVVGTHK